MRRARFSSKTVTVPDVVGLTLAEAEHRVVVAGLMLGTAQQSSRPPGRRSRQERHLSWQEPDAGSQLRRSAMVTAGFGSRGGGLSGDREPRVPTPTSRSESASLLQWDDEVAISD